MTKPPNGSTEFWADVSDVVTAKVRPVLGANEAARGPVIEYLRDLETLARSQGGDRGSIQIIMSGRALLGDKVEVGPADGPFSRT